MRNFARFLEDRRRSRAAAILGPVMISLIGAWPAAGVQRKLVRDFPQFTYCPIHSGKPVEVDQVGNPCVLVPLTGPTRVQEALAFTATGTRMLVTFSTCLDGAVLDPGTGVKLDNFAVVRDDLLRTEQIDRRDSSVPPVRRAPDGDFEPGGCYVSSPSCENTVGSVVVPALVSACGPSSASCPFGDDFQDTTLSQCRWRVSGLAEIDGTAKELVLARTTDQDPSPCSGAAVMVKNLIPGQGYILDFDWWAAEFEGGEGLITVDIGPPPSTHFFAVAPCRVLDTRGAVGPSGGPALAAGQSRVVALAGSCGIPADADAVALNLTVTQPSTAGHLRLYPADTALTGASSLNYTAGQTRANNAVVSLSACGALALYAGQGGGTAHAIIDVTGYFR